MSALLLVPRKASGTKQVFHKRWLCEGMDEQTDGQLSSRWPVSFLNGEDHTWLDLPEPTPTVRGGQRCWCCVLSAVSPPQPNSAPPSAAKPSGRKSTNPGKCSAQFLAHGPEESQLKTRTRSSASQDSCTPHARLMPPQMMKGMEGLKSHSRAK